MAESNSLYIHIPFCEHICSYCDFTKIIKNNNLSFVYGLDVIKSLNKLLKQGRKYNTIYIGGGTPSCLDDFVLENILILCSKMLNNDYEFTIELNVESVSEQLAKLLKKYSINRISIGIQTFNNDLLNKFNRKHTGEDAINAVKLMKRYFTNINVDLIYGAEFSSLNILKKDLEIISTLNVQHVSTYSLQINEGTMLYNNKVKELNQDDLRLQIDLIHEYLTSLGFIHYEVSNYAKDGFYSKHNLTYWKNKEYDAIGAGAAGYSNNIRYTYTKNILKYLANHFKEEETISSESKLEYEVMLGLRTIFGLDIDHINKEYNIDFLTKYSSKLDNLFKNKFIFIENNHLKCSYNGLFVLDAIILNIF